MNNTRIALICLCAITLGAQTHAQTAAGARPAGEPVGASPAGEPVGASPAGEHEVIGASTQPVHIEAASSQATSSAAPPSDEALISDSRLDQMLAPIALYPDSVLTHILIASTYPLEIVEADRWRQDNVHLNAEQALQAAETQAWDASVMALVAFPELLSRMSQDLRWTQELGDAFLLSEMAVMDRVQALRDAAYNAGGLQSTPEVEVVVEKQIIESVERRTIIIEPVVERVVYLPHYDTRRVYGTWHWSSHPPLYWDPFHAHVVHHHHRVYWGPAIRVAPTFYVGAFHWSRRQLVVINHIQFRSDPQYYRSRALAHHHDAVHWRHMPHHRRGVAYHPGYISRHAHRPEYREYRGYKDGYRDYRPNRDSGYDQRRRNAPVHRAPQRPDRHAQSARPATRDVFDASPPRSYRSQQSPMASGSSRERVREHVGQPRQQGLLSAAQQHAERAQIRQQARGDDQGQRYAEPRAERQSRSQAGPRAQRQSRSEAEPRAQRQSQERAAPPRESRGMSAQRTERQPWRGDNRRDR